ncbi:hypothetical protein C2E23DRAFT_828076 [Lenzites betulinus]|nr:hypothetical protein C2E23DRAFT_828076 [Lenzites betulinus]
MSFTGGVSCSSHSGHGDGRRSSSGRRSGPSGNLGVRNSVVLGARDRAGRDRACRRPDRRARDRRAGGRAGDSELRGAGHDDGGGHRGRPNGSGSHRLRRRRCRRNGRGCSVCAFTVGGGHSDRGGDGASAGHRACGGKCIGGGRAGRYGTSLNVIGVHTSTYGGDSCEDCDKFTGRERVYICLCGCGTSIDSHCAPSVQVVHSAWLSTVLQRR